jgi:hypothetical protein
MADGTWYSVFGCGLYGLRLVFGFSKNQWRAASQDWVLWSGELMPGDIVEFITKPEFCFFFLLQFLSFSSRFLFFPDFFPRFHISVKGYSFLKECSFIKIRKKKKNQKKRKDKKRKREERNSGLAMNSTIVCVACGVLCL